jgi:hypothetical protein
MALLLIFAAIVLVVWLNLAARRLRRDGHWHIDNAGTMCRWAGYSWVRRKMDELEWAEYRDDGVW